MRYYELNEKDKSKYGEELLSLIERRKQKHIGADKIEDYVLCELSDGSKIWIYYPDID